MALITRQVKVSHRVEQRLEDLLGVDHAIFKRVKSVTPMIFRFTFFLMKKGDMVGTINFFWDLTKIQQFFVVKRLSDGAILKLRHINEPRLRDFFA